MRTTDMEARHTRLREILTESRKGRDLTQVELGERLGKNQVWISKYEAGSRKLDVIEFVDVAHAIGVDPCDLLQQLNLKKESRKSSKSRK